LDGDAAEVFAVERVKRDAELWGEVFAEVVEQQVVEEQLVAVAALLVDGLVVVLARGASACCPFSVRSAATRKWPAGAVRERGIVVGTAALKVWGTG